MFTKEIMSNSVSKNLYPQKASVCAEEWLSYIKCCRKYSTYIKYKYIYETHLQDYFEEIDFSELSISKCSDILLQEYQNHGQTLSLSIMNSMTYVLNQILKHGQAGFAVILPEYIRSDKKFDKREIAVLSQSEQKQFITYLSKDIDIYKAGILLCLFSGLRLGEICALTTDNINMKKRILRVAQTVQRIKNENGSGTILYCAPPKTLCSIRDVPLCDYIIHTLEDFEISGKYFINGDFPMEPRTYQYKFNRYLKEASLPERNFHSLRHTFATNCIANGMDVKCLSEILGHSDVKTTMNRYVHPSMETKQTQINQCIAAFL